MQQFWYMMVLGKSKYQKVNKKSFFFIFIQIQEHHLFF